MSVAHRFLGTLRAVDGSAAHGNGRELLGPGKQPGFSGAVTISASAGKPTGVKCDVWESCVSQL